jgi:L-amino acid N-acyltransferase YncA
MMTQEDLNYRQLITLRDGVRVLLRLLTADDRQRLVDLYHAAGPEDLRYMRHEVSDRQIVEAWVDGLDYDVALPLVALVGERIVGNSTLHLGTGPSRHIAEVRIYLAKDFRRRGLGTRMLQTLVDMAKRRQIHYILAQVVVDQTNEVKAFQQMGFERKCTMDNFFMLPDGDLRDVVQMVLRLRTVHDEF